MTLRLKKDRMEAYGLLGDTVRVLGRKDRPGYKVGHIYAVYLGGYDSYGAREMSGYFKPSDFAGISHD